jgi:hypothetical protein
MEAAESFIESRPAEELGCLYYSRVRDTFDVPDPDRSLATQGITLPYGSPGGVLPLPSGVPIAPRES